VVDHHEQPVDGAEPDRVDQEVQLTGGRLFLGEEVVEGAAKRLGALDHVGSLPRHQVAQMLVQVHCGGPLLVPVRS
jgi:hypothetical protein